MKTEKEDEYKMFKKEAKFGVYVSQVTNDIIKTHEYYNFYKIKD